MKSFLQAICILSATSAIAAEPLTLRQQFFKDSKSARLIDGSQQDCCGVGDAVRVKILAQSGSVIAAEIIDTMRHPAAKVGQLINVPVNKLARWPLAPSQMGTILFINYGLHPYCLMQRGGF